MFVIPALALSAGLVLIIHYDSLHCSGTCVSGGILTFLVVRNKYIPRQFLEYSHVFSHPNGNLALVSQYSWDVSWVALSEPAAQSKQNLVQNKVILMDTLVFCRNILHWIWYLDRPRFDEKKALIRSTKWNAVFAIHANLYAQSRHCLSQLVISAETSFHGGVLNGTPY